MTGLLLLIPIALALGLVGLAAFFMGASFRPIRRPRWFGGTHSVR